MNSNDLCFLPYDVEDASHYIILKRQRMLCGWNHDDETLTHWAQLIKTKRMMRWWICSRDGGQDSGDSAEIMTESGHAQLPTVHYDPSFRPDGHIGLEFLDEEGSAVRRAKVSSFFILKSSRGKRLGSRSMDFIEDKARELGVEVLVIDTLSQSVVVDEEHWKKLGLDGYPSERPQNELWYKRRNYVPFKREPRYPCTYLDGSQTLLESVFMERKL